MIKIKSNVIELLSVTEQFLDLMWSWERNSKTMKNIGENRLLSLEQYRLEKRKLLYDPYMILGIYHKIDKKFIGYFILENIDYRNRNVTIHSCMGDIKYQNSILVIRAFSALINYIKTELNLKNIITYLLNFNTSAKKILTKFQFRKVGEFNNYLNNENLLIYQKEV